MQVWEKPTAFFFDSLVWPALSVHLPAQACLPAGEFSQFERRDSHHDIPGQEDAECLSLIALMYRRFGVLPHLARLLRSHINRPGAVPHGSQDGEARLNRCSVISNKPR